MHNCFVLLTQSRHGAPKTDVSSIYLVKYVYHETNIMLHTV